MKFTDWEKISLRVIGLFATAMLASYSPMFLRGFFGDTPNSPDSLGLIWHGGFFDEQWSWGFRHYLYFWMCVILFLIQAVKIIKWISTRNDDTSFPV